MNALIALETKGDHLQNPDTDYMRAVLNYLTSKFDWKDSVPVGELELEGSTASVELALILMADIKAQLPRYLSEVPAHA
jgi:type III restriction enzyme